MTLARRKDVGLLTPHCFSLLILVKAKWAAYLLGGIEFWPPETLCQSIHGVIGNSFMCAFFEHFWPAYNGSKNTKVRKAFKQIIHEKERNFSSDVILACRANTLACETSSLAKHLRLQNEFMLFFEYRLQNETHMCTFGQARSSYENKRLEKY